MSSMAEKIKVNVKVMDVIAYNNVLRLAQGLDRIDGFQFFVDAQFMVNPVDIKPNVFAKQIWDLQAPVEDFLLDDIKNKKD